MTHSSFHFSGYSWNHHAGKVTLRYSLDQSVDFEETIILPEPISNTHLQEHEWQLERLLFALHMIGGISYYKTYIPNKIFVHSGELSKEEASFWDDVYIHGLGEFFFRNNIEFRGLIKMPISKKKSSLSDTLRVRSLSDRYREKPINQQRVLVPFGGGKDSIVTAELLRKAGAHVTLFRLGHHPIIDELQHIAGFPLITVKRSISHTLFELNAAGALNGHVPITAYVSILALLVAELYGFDAVVMSNERSANHGNVEFKGMEINHQWSKSIDFERALRNFLGKTIDTSVQYYSLLRPLSELKIAEIFSRYPTYFTTATSCNANWKILGDDESEQRWCQTCPKCGFVFAILAAYLEPETLFGIFGKNLWNDAALIPLYRELLGIQNFKPFECVGTADETRAAFLLARKHKDYASTPIMEMFSADVLPLIKHPEALIAQTLRENHDHCVPAQLLPLLA